MVNNINNILLQLFFGVVVYILAVCIGVFIKNNSKFYYPIIFGVLYGNYLLIRSSLIGYNI